MPHKQQKMFTIGQFAALHGVNKKTLMWYDEIGLFSPAQIDDANGYRLYSYFQSVELETILLLRDMGVSLPDIKSFMGDKSVSGMEQLLSAQISKIDERMRSMKALRSRLAEYRKDIGELLRLDVDKIVLTTRLSQYIVLVPTSSEYNFDEDLARITDTAAEFRLPRLYQVSVGSMLPVESIYAHRMDDYAYHFISVPNAKNKKSLHRMPSGKYLRAFCKGPWEKLPERYEEILQFAEANSLRLSGFAYETGMNDLVISSMDEYVTKIEIPVL